MLRIFKNSLKPHLLEKWSASFECTLTVPNYRVRNNEICHILETKINWAVAFGRKICNSWEHSYVTQLQNQKKVTPENYQDLSSLIWKQNTQSMTVLWQHTTTVLGISISWIICSLSFLKVSENITKIVVSRELKKIWHSWLEVKFTTPEITLTGLNYSSGNSDFE